MEERILTADIIEDFRKNLELQEKSTSTIEKYIRDVKAFSVYACLLYTSDAADE